MSASEGPLSERPHLSIGEVLSLLQEDFPDITISKIRFLESQGLLDPERTPSGYRKFYDDDIARLRWILYQQRENFLPLKIIKDRLSRGDVDFEAEGPPKAGDGGGDVAMSPAGLLQESPRGDDHLGASEATTAPRGRTRTGAASGAADEGRGVSLTLEELCTETGLSARDIGELERFGMLDSRELGTTAYYDDRAIEVARLAATFHGHGVEARHLRMFLMAAQREVGVYEQLLLPILRKRGPDSPADASALAAELVELGEALQGVFVRQLLADYLDRT